MIFSAAATESSNVRFAESGRRLNVAFTRARKKLIVLANDEAPWGGSHEAVRREREKRRHALLLGARKLSTSQA